MFIKVRQSPKNLLAMTLVEVMVAAGIGSIVLSAMAALTIYSARTIASMSNYVDLDQDSRQALDLMIMKIRQASGVTSYTTNKIDLSYQGGTLTYTYSPSAKTLVETYGSTSKTLLTECDAFRFDIYQRNPINGTFDQYPTAVATNAKLVQITWTCSRTLLGKAVNTESMESAKVVIRKQ